MYFAIVSVYMCKIHVFFLAVSVRPVRGSRVQARKRRTGREYRARVMLLEDSAPAPWSRRETCVSLVGACGTWLAGEGKDWSHADAA